MLVIVVEMHRRLASGYLLFNKAPSVGRSAGVRGKGRRTREILQNSAGGGGSDGDRNGACWPQLDPLTRELICLGQLCS